VATGSGNSLGAALMALVAPVARTTKQMIAYILSPRTGASVGSVARQLGVKTRTVRGWQSGKSAPSAASEDKIEEVYKRFFRLNNKSRPVREINTAALSIKNTSDPAGIVFHTRGKPDRVSNPLVVERSTQRKWEGVIAAKTPEEAYEKFVDDVIGPSPLPGVPEYLEFLDGDYTITS
jgi:transcriptional regulator with XRE-family HTH domain